MSVEKVREYLKSFGLEDRVMEFTVSSATVELAAKAVGVEEAQIAKSMSFMLKDGHAVLVITAGDVKIDNAKYKAFFGCKAKMLTSDEVGIFTGHMIGGVCPFALADESVKVYLDDSMKRFSFIYPAAGSAASAVKLTCDELFTSSKAQSWVDVTKPACAAAEG